MAETALIKTLLPRLFEDDHFVAVHKPAGVDVGGLEGQTGVIDILAATRRTAEPLYVVNRLSRYESGVLLLAKSPEAAEFVRNGLKGQRVAQEFVAVVVGRMKDRKLVLSRIGAGDRVSIAPRGRPTGRERTSAATARRKETAVTTLLLVEQGERRSLIRCRTSAPNTHALRAQLRSVRLRLVGDNVHDPSPRRQLNEDTCLHLARFTFHHPTLRTRVGILAPPPDFSEALAGRFDAERVLRAGLARRLALLVSKETNGLRLITGAFEGLRGINVEQYGDVIIIYVLEEKAGDPKALARIGRWYLDTLDAKSVYVKPFVKDRVDLDDAAAKQLRSARPLLGAAAPEEVEIRERDLRFLIRPYAGWSVGLFLDHRQNRARIREMAAAADVLNLFAYTCGFSVAAAAGGAASTVSVDLSPKSLEWGRANFALNHIDLEHHAFTCADAFDYLRRAKRQGNTFDLIVLDPPSFAHGRKSGKDFSITSDLPRLVSAALDVLRPGGHMMVSTNYRRMSLRELKDLVRRGSTRPMRIIAAPPLPLDYAVDRDHAKTIFAQFDASQPDGVGPLSSIETES